MGISEELRRICGWILCHAILADDGISLNGGDLVVRSVCVGYGVAGFPEPIKVN